jgi:hypothetical protein
MGWICKLPHRQCDNCRFLVIDFYYDDKECFVATCHTHACSHGYELMHHMKIESIEGEE